MDAFGGVHILVCNAGILRDKSFTSMTDDEWEIVYKVHLHGTYTVCKAAWELFQKQKYGRIATTTSGTGLYGNFGQANYATAKAAIIAFTKTLAVEGKKYGIFANVIAPQAGTAMTRTIWPEEMIQAFSPDYVAPVVGYLSSESSSTTGKVYEVSGGWVANVRWQRAYGHAFPVDKTLTPELVRDKWDVINRFDAKATHPSTPAESLEAILDNFNNTASGSGGEEDYTDSEDPELVKQAKKDARGEGSYTYTERDVALYNLGIGATEKDVKWVFEGDENFQAIPTFGVIPQFAVSSGLSRACIVPLCLPEQLRR